MRQLPVFLLVPLILVLVLTAFLGGRWLERRRVDSGPFKAIRLKKDMAILNSAGDPKGVLPRETVIYVVPGVAKWADTPYSLFKVYVQVMDADASDLEPSSEDEKDVNAYHVRSYEWLKRAKEAGTGQTAPSSSSRPEP